MSKSIRIYFEGGGPSNDGKTKLRQGMDGFLSSLKELAREKHWQWRLIPCGGRADTWAAFQNAGKHHTDATNILLVDSEGPVTAPTPKQHLAQLDHWPVPGIREDCVHLMAQCMETWIVADPDALARHYGEKFTVNVLPKRDNLEEESKTGILDALKRATQNTAKGEYGKIKHAAAILPKLDSRLVRGRCPHAGKFFAMLTTRLAA
jgi:hypothetical protein